MIYFFVGLIALVIAYLLFDYLQESRIDRARERLMADVYDTEEEEEVSLWSDAADLLQLETMQRILEDSVLARRFDKHLKKSGINLSLPKIFLILLATTAIVAGGTYAYFKMLLAPVVSSIAIPVLFWLILSKLAERRTRRLDEQLPAMVSQFLTTLRSGGTPLQAMQSISRNAPSPIRESIGDLLHTMQIGVPATQAWREWSLFWDTRSAHMLSMGIRLKWETGGQMTAILAHILDSMEFHKRMELRVETITAQAKLSAYILTGLPFAVAMTTYSIRPDLFEHMINDPFGKKALMFTGALLTVGFIWLRKMAKLEQ